MPDLIDGLEVTSVDSEEEFLEHVKQTASAFGDEARESLIEEARALAEFDRLWAVRDAGQIVATSAIISMTVAVPGGQLPMAGVTSVGVLPTHRRRGILRGLMRRMLDQAGERHEPLAGLWASESVLYGRYGFGAATIGEHFRLDMRHGQFRTAVDRPATLRLVDPVGALKELPPVFDRLMDTVPGVFGRSPAYWRTWIGQDPEHDREGAGPRFIAVWEDRGYVLYRFKQDWSSGSPNHTLHVEELVALDNKAHSGLWRWLLDMELSSTLVARHCPADDPLPYLLADARRLRIERSDALWLRPVDVVTALSGRRYPIDGRVVLDLHDEFCPSNAGRWLLEVSDGIGTCRSTTEDADLTLGAEELSMTYLGGASLQRLARAGRVEEHRHRALAHADRLFAWPRAPWCPQEF